MKVGESISKAFAEMQKIEKEKFELAFSTLNDLGLLKTFENLVDKPNIIENHIGKTNSELSDEDLVSLYRNNKVISKLRTRDITDVYRTIKKVLVMLSEDVDTNQETINKIMPFIDKGISAVSKKADPEQEKESLFNDDVMFREVEKVKIKEKPISGRLELDKLFDATSKNN